MEEPLETEQRHSVRQFVGAGLLLALTPYVQINSKDFRQRFARFLVDTPSDQVDRVSVALDALLERKLSLIKELSGDFRVPYTPTSSLGAICISCVESHVTPILADCGIATEMIARQYPHEWRQRNGFPPIHAYNLIDLGRSRFVLDLDADPFFGADTGVVVAPIEAHVPIYNVGFEYHKRSFAPTGEIVEFSCMYLDDEHGQRVYMDGDWASHISIVPYHFESDANRCPIVVSGGTTLHFGYDKCWDIKGNVLHSISLTCVCPVQVNRGGIYNLHFQHIQYFNVKRTEDLGTTISIAFDDTSHFEMLIASDGTLIPNNYISLHNSRESMPETISVRLTGGHGQPVKLNLPYPEQAHDLSSCFTTRRT
jgi:hypothetical protein